MPRNPTPAPDPWRFFALALGLSWAFWAPVALAGWNIWSWPAVGLGALGLFGPALAEAVLVGRARDHALRHDYLQRLVDLRRIPPGVWAVLVLGFPLINALAMLWGAALGQPWPGFETARALLEAPWRLLPFAAFVLLFGPLPEELGWRGYALDGLQARFSALTASLLLGLVWAGWHLPLFFMPGTYQHDRLGLATPGFWAFVLGTVVTSVLFTWVYNRANRSTLAAVLFHFSINFSGELFALSEPTQVFRTVLVALWAAAVVVVEGPRTLRGGASWARFLGRGAFAPRFRLRAPLAAAEARAVPVAARRAPAPAGGFPGPRAGTGPGVLQRRGGPADSAGKARAPRSAAAHAGAGPPPPCARRSRVPRGLHRRRRGRGPSLGRWGVRRRLSGRGAGRAARPPPQPA